mgnify:CR=1 FL=1
MFKRLFRGWFRRPDKEAEIGDEVDKLEETAPPFDPLKPYIITAMIKVEVMPHPIETFSTRVAEAFDKEAVSTVLTIRKTIFFPTPNGKLKVFHPTSDETQKGKMN